MSKEIIRFYDTIEGNLSKRSIFGLNIFNANEVDTPNELSPQLKVLQIISKQFDASALTGNLSDFGDTPNDLFEGSAYFESFYQSRIGVYGGEFYDSRKWPSFPPLFFPKIGPDFFEIGRKEYLAENIIYSDALGLFIGDILPNSVKMALELFNKSLEGEFFLLNQLANLFKIILVSNADGDFFTLYAGNSHYFEMFSETLNEIESEIRNSEWFVTNESKLIWDDEYSMCLVLET